MNEYIKDFEGWSSRKKIINERRGALFVKERDIWWMSIGVNIGTEIDGKNDLYERPVLVLKKLHNHKFFGVPITSSNKAGNFFVPITFGTRQGSAVLIDMRSFDTRRLLRKVTSVRQEDFNRVIESLRNLL